MNKNNGTLNIFNVDTKSSYPIIQQISHYLRDLSNNFQLEASKGIE